MQDKFVRQRYVAVACSQRTIVSTSCSRDPNKDRYIKTCCDHCANVRPDRDCCNKSYCERCTRGRSIPGQVTVLGQSHLAQAMTVAVNANGRSQLVRAQTAVETVNGQCQLAPAITATATPASLGKAPTARESRPSQTAVGPAYVTPATSSIVMTPERCQLKV
jgi:hypothetical protein